MTQARVANHQRQRQFDLSFTWCIVLMRATAIATAAAENVVWMFFYSCLCLFHVYKIESECVSACFFVFALCSLWYCMLFIISLLDQTIELSFRYRLFVTFLIIFFSLSTIGLASDMMLRLLRLLLLVPQLLLLLPAHQPVHSSIFPFIRPFAPYTATIS